MVDSLKLAAKNFSRPNQANFKLTKEINSTITASHINSNSRVFSGLLPTNHQM